MTEHGKYSGVVDIARNGIDEVVRLGKEVDRLTQRVEQLEAELDEQCRLNGMGSEREARLLARVDALERKLARYVTVFEVVRVYFRYEAEPEKQKKAEVFMREAMNRYKEFQETEGGEK